MRSLWAALLSTASAISLSDFTPSAAGLTEFCLSVYTTTISGCTSSDFDEQRECSAECVEGLLGITEVIIAQCSTSPDDDQLLIRHFLLGDGLTQLCPNVVIVTAEPTSPTSISKTSTTLTTTRTSASFTRTSHAVSATLSASSSVTSTKATSQSTQISESTRPSASTRPTHSTSSLSSSSSSSSSLPLPTSNPTSEAASRCMEEESNPFNFCDQMSGAGAVALSSWMMVLVVTSMLLV